MLDGVSIATQPCIDPRLRSWGVIAGCYERAVSWSAAVCNLATKLREAAKTEAIEEYGFPVASVQLYDFKYEVQHGNTSYNACGSASVFFEPVEVVEEVDGRAHRRVSLERHNAEDSAVQDA